jgi:SAM-dependent methyltransferase
MKSGIKTVEVPCPLCGEAEYRLVAKGRDREYDNTTDDEFGIVVCVRCGLHRLNPRPDQSELETIYPPNYHAYNIRPVSDQTASLPMVTRLRHTLYSRRFRRPLRYLDGRATIDLLDVGCGDGWMLDLYRRQGRDRIRTFGVDFNPAACEAARRAGHTVFCSRFEDLEMPERFDLVNLSHVIEHVADPVAFAGRVRDVLRPGGVFVLETPNIATVEARIFSANWGAYHIPRHWTLFSPQSIRALGESAGLSFREILFHPAPVHWVWTFNSTARAHGGSLAQLAGRAFAPLDVFRGGPKPFVLLSLFSCVDWILAVITGQTSNMMAIFQKELR